LAHATLCHDAHERVEVAAQIARDERARPAMEELDLVQAPPSLECHLIEVLLPFPLRRAREQTVEAQVLALAIEARNGEQLDLRVGLPVLLHVEMAVEVAGRNDEAHLAELVERSAQLGAQRGRGVDEQFTACQPNDGHPPADFEAEIANWVLGDSELRGDLRQVRCHLMKTGPMVTRQGVATPGWFLLRWPGPPAHAPGATKSPSAWSKRQTKEAVLRPMPPRTRCSYRKDPCGAVPREEPIRTPREPNGQRDRVTVWNAVGLPPEREESSPGVEH